MAIFEENLSIENINRLYKAQEAAYSNITGLLKDFDDIVLVGGTPLARCYLNHRVSYDLDFSMDPKIGHIAEAVDIVKKSKNIITISYNVSESVYGCAFFQIKQDGVDINFSLTEDRKYGRFRKVRKTMGDIEVITCDIDTLYYNKLRTIVGDFPGTNRTKFRDVVDIYVLSKTYQNLTKFLDNISEIDPFFSVDAFLDALANYDWIKTMKQEINVALEWKSDIESDDFSDKLYAEAGFNATQGEYWNQEETSDKEMLDEQAMQSEEALGEETMYAGKPENR